VICHVVKKRGSQNVFTCVYVWYRHTCEEEIYICTYICREHILAIYVENTFYIHVYMYMCDTDTRVKKRYTSLMSHVKQMHSYIYISLLHTCVCITHIHVNMYIECVLYIYITWDDRLMLNKDIHMTMSYQCEEERPQQPRTHSMTMSYQCLSLTCIWMSLFNIHMKVIWMSFCDIHMNVFFQHIYVENIFWLDSVFVGNVVYVSCAFKKTS